MDIAEFKERAHATWAAGNYPTIAGLIWAVGERIVDRVGVSAGDDVIDVACGNGNVAIRAAQHGGHVVAVDIAPELFESGRKLADEVGVEVDWVSGDAEDLPFHDASFDVVFSTFGVMFAPRHSVAAQEIARVMRPGARLGLCNWTPEGAIGRFFGTVASYMPPPPEFAQPPVLWGKEDHVREIFEGTGVELEFERELVEFRFDSVDDAVKTFTTNFGPLVKARELLEPQGRWSELENAYREFIESNNKAKDGLVAYDAEYLVVTGTMRD